MASMRNDHAVCTQKLYKAAQLSRSEPSVASAETQVWPPVISKPVVCNAFYLSHVQDICWTSCGMMYLGS